MKTRTRQHTRVWFFFLITLIGLTACQTETKTTEPAIGTTEPVQVTEEITATVTPTPTKGLSGVILVASPDADPVSQSQIQAALTRLVSEEELETLNLESFAGEMITPAVKIVIGVGPGLNMVNLAASNPETAFVLVDDPDAIPSANLTVIGDPVVEIQHQYFLAGYLSALISEDYKAAVLIPANDENGNTMINSFMVGTEFFCGVCNPLHPPYNDFPYWQTLSLENALSGFEPVIDSLVIYGVEVLFIPEVLASSELLSYVGTLGLKVVSDGPPDMARNNWVGSVMVDKGEALVELWPHLISRSEGVQVPGVLSLSNMEAGLVSAGRLSLFEEMVADLSAGLISPISIP